MKRKIAYVLLLAIIFSLWGCSKEPTEEYIELPEEMTQSVMGDLFDFINIDLDGLSFGMSKDRIVTLWGEPYGEDEINGTSLFFLKEKYLTKSLQITEANFHFTEEDRITGVEMNLTVRSEEFDYASYRRELRQEISEQYGAPVIDQIDWWKNEPEDLSDTIINQAVASGDLTMYMKWEKGNEEISCQIDRGYIALVHKK